MRKLKEVLCKKLKDFREISGLTLDQVSIALNTTPATVSRWESGKYEPSLDTIDQLAELYNIDRDAFFIESKKTISISEKKLQDTVDSLKEIINAASLPNCPRDIFEKLTKIKSDNSQFWEILDSSLEAESEIEDEEKRDVVKKKFG